MIFTLLSHEWKSFWRARNAGTQLVIQILVGLVVLYFLLIAIAGAFFLAEELEKYFPKQDVVVVFCGFVLYYFAVDLIMRFQLQELPTLIVQPYLIQNIRRRQLVRFLNLSSLFSIFNLVPFILVGPFLVIRVYPSFGGLVVLAMLLTVASLTFFNHFLIMLVKRKTTVSGLWTVGFLAVVLALGGADYFGLFSLRAVSSFLFVSLLKYPALCLAPMAITSSVFYINYSFLTRNLYLEEIVKSSRQKTSTEYTWLNRFGLLGEILGMDIKLIIRNKRMRALLVTSSLLLFYGFFLFKADAVAKGKLGPLLFGSIFITLSPITQFSILIFSSQCSFFDGLMTTNLPLHTYIKGKLTLLNLLGTLAVFPVLLYGILTWKLIPIIIAAYLFNAGVSAVIYLYAATFYHKAIDIEKATVIFSQKGFNATQLIYPLVVALIGVVAYLPLAYFIDPWVGIAAIALVGVVSLLLRDRWITIIANQFLRMKYKMLEGFREK